MATQGRPVDRFAVAGKVAVVTGAASGIGRGIALLLASAGASVVIADIDEAGLAETRRQIEIAEGCAFAWPTDVCDKRQVDGLACAALERFGTIDIWVNAAGILLYGPITGTELADMDRILGVNLSGVYWCCAAAARAMAESEGGSIINISSTGADAPVPGLSLYSLTKAAVNMLTQTAAAEFGSAGIRVNAIAPGFVDTPMVTYRFRDADGQVDPEMREALLADRAKDSPLGVTGSPDDIAFAALYLASDASRIVTGQVLRVNGGVSMR